MQHEVVVEQLRACRALTDYLAHAGQHAPVAPEDQARLDQETIHFRGLNLVGAWNRGGRACPQFIREVLYPPAPFSIASPRK